MNPVLVPTNDVNSEHGILVMWFAEDGAEVEKDELLAEVETSKAVLEVLAPVAGVLLHTAAKGAEVPLSQPIAQLFGSAAERDAHLAALAAAPATAAPAGPRATVKAVQRAAELGVDLAALGLDRLITVKDVEACAAPAVPPALLEPLAGAPGRQRILIVGAALGATQVLDILAGSRTQQAVAIVDDDASRWGASVHGVPVVGGSDRLGALFAEGAYDAAIIAIGRSPAVRARLRAACAAAGVPLANAIDPTAKIATDVSLGQGNIICAFCHIATGVRVGDNNFFSAYNSFDHHSVIGDDNASGPSVVTSGKVTIGSRIRFGTGIFIEPDVTVGDDAAIASGAVIVSSVPAEHVVKTKIVTTTVVPLRR
ncbi:bifunctional N-acetylglucosamine-1-phosphate uridyltransferase/glucosamine-1-phosphate acetyltransferase [Actinoplanes sp. SE50]|uniref:biotin/lipoyl-containing protein n=1 Tax=unclassified Actinoplanes TaxID=2626549 RepID=UPI00023EBEEE|nr:MULTISPECIES: biotin/lipoyl-containing protein [unclassified Actinoplanes]AEV84017.1 Bifunctional protein glmU [Actinoplanes sp. SE50/110]ATO82410.1 bifunctional N-acetylglucosamine-1-phosphate uridyltransferase/glucosamine-1-phosphate acetyltransferase [Actinoplanes sp. SE50]SLL99817.1 bifunctional N-acetylglucosamine-1-phosphate uridyltransferase/glucosamine-1-phosphate acetyltransferase [Actinoplanes sp. SE50/110]